MGSVALTGEQLLCTQTVGGSNPLHSTKMRDNLMHLSLEISDQDVTLVHSEDLGPETLIYMLAAVQNKVINDVLVDDKDRIILKVAEILGKDAKSTGPKPYDPDDFSVQGVF